LTSGLFCDKMRHAQEDVMSTRKRTWTTSAGDAREAWIADYSDGAGERHIATFERKKDAEAFLASVKVDVSKGIHVAPSKSVTVAEACGLWLQSGENNGLERATLDSYRQHTSLHIIPFLGSSKLSALTTAGIRHFEDTLRAKGRSPVMARRVLTSLGSMLADAQERGLVAQNVVRSLRAGRRGKDRVERRQNGKLKVGVDIPTNAEIKAIVDALKGRWRPLILTAIFTGLRASELRGLRWADVDLKKAELHVRQRADRYNVIGQPKSHSGERTVPMLPLLVNTLREWRLACPKGELDLVFPNGAGKIENHQNILARGYFPAQEAAGVVTKEGTAKYTGLHALRHWFASWCINRKADGGLELPLKVVQERLGHSTVVLTSDRYGHLFPRGDDSSELAAAERALLG
jgi:integrase